MNRTCRAVVVTFVACWSLGVRLNAAETVDHPFLGVTHVTRVETSPRNVTMHIIQIDLTIPGIGFKVTPPGGTLETVRQTTLGFLNAERAQVAINSHFFLPFPSPSPNAMLIGLAASLGNVFSVFESPVQSYAIVRNAPAINIDFSNHASVVHRDPTVADGLHVIEPVLLWNAVAGSAQIITDGVKTIPVYVDAANPDGLLTPGSPANYSNSNSWYNLINARAAIGLSKDSRTLFLFTVDRAGGSLGMSVGEVADLLLNSYGVYNALNLDGGGSTTLAMEDAFTHLTAIVNVSSDNPAGRAVASNLAVFAPADIIAPVTTAVVSPSPNVNGWNRTNVTVLLTATDNPGGWVKEIQYSSTGAQVAGPTSVAGSVASNQITAEGTTTLTYVARDFLANQEPTQTLTVGIDRTPPTVWGMPVTGCTLWPVDSGMRYIGTIQATDALSGIASGTFHVTVVSNEPSDPLDPDVVMSVGGAGEVNVQLRATRLGKGSGRVYTVTASAEDLAGNTQVVTSTCIVPHDQRRP